MANGVVDRQEWALVVRELLDDELASGGRGSRTRFAEKVGINVRTLGHWLAGTVDVSEANVRKVAKAYGINEMELLIRVGVYALEQMPERPAPSPFDPDRQAVLDSDLPAKQKALILKKLDEMEAADEALIQQQRERDKQRRAERIAAMIEQQSSGRRRRSA